MLFTGEGHAPAPLTGGRTPWPRPDADAGTAGGCSRLAASRGSPSAATGDEERAALFAAICRACAGLAAGARAGARSRRRARRWPGRDRRPSATRPDGTALRITEGARRLRQARRLSDGLVELAGPVGAAGGRASSTGRPRGASSTIARAAAARRWPSPTGRMRRSSPMTPSPGGWPTCPRARRAPG
jgi:hypothetical protein